MEGTLDRENRSPSRAGEGSGLAAPERLALAKAGRASAGEATGVPEVRSFGRWKKRERSPSEPEGSTEADRRVVKRTVPRGGVGRKSGDHPGNRRDASARSRGCWEAEVGQTHPASRPTGSRKANRTVSDRRTRNRASEGRAVERLRAPRARPSRTETAATLTHAVAGRRRNRCAGLCVTSLRTTRGGSARGRKHAGMWLDGRRSGSMLGVSFTGGARGGPGQAGELVSPCPRKTRLQGGKTAADRLEPTTGGACEATENVRGRSDSGQGSSSREGAGGPTPAVPEGRRKGALARSAERASLQFSRGPRDARRKAVRLVRRNRIDRSWRKRIAAPPLSCPASANCVGLAWRVPTPHDGAQTAQRMHESAGSVFGRKVDRSA